MKEAFIAPQELVLGTRLNSRVLDADQKRQREEVEDILRRLSTQPGVVLADEVGMGKTYVALGIAYSVARSSPRGPVIVMVPPNLIDKWEEDLKKFCGLYLDDRHPIKKDTAARQGLMSRTAFRYGIARHSVELMKMLDDPPRERCHLIFLAQGAMGRRQTDKWVRLALIGEALRRHGRGGAARLIQVKKQIHRFLGELIFAIGEERAHAWGIELWQKLLHTDPRIWKEIYNKHVPDENRQLKDDPVPKSVVRALNRVELGPLAKSLEELPVRSSGSTARTSNRIRSAGTALRQVEEKLWKVLLLDARWCSPLLIMDEAHHLKNPGCLLARQLQSPNSEKDLRTGDGAMARAFDRMLFLTATPFQIGHHELVRVLERFGDIRWDEDRLGDLAGFKSRIANLHKCLDESQRSAIALQRAWSRLQPEDCYADSEGWWERILQSSREILPSRLQAVVDAYKAARACRDAAEKALRPWIVRHNKGTFWVGTSIARRHRKDGAAISGSSGLTGLPIPPRQLLPFFLAARSAVNPKKDLLGEALCSSYEAFRSTRERRDPGKDEQDDPQSEREELAKASWYLDEFDYSLTRYSGVIHPKIQASVRKVVDLWEKGEKVLVFAFYRRTCRALRIHISREIERRVKEAAIEKLRSSGAKINDKDLDRLVERIQQRFFDDSDSPGRKAVDAALEEILAARAASLNRAGISGEQCEQITDVMRRFLRVPTTLLRCFPIREGDSLSPINAVRVTLDFKDGSGLSWLNKFYGFIDFMSDIRSSEERALYLEAALRTQTGGIRVERDEEDDLDPDEKLVVIANVQVATGTTHRDARSRLMRAFNTPFFPDVLVCSQVMGEGVDLQRFCRHVIHHDLAWNPSTIEQRTGRIDRLGCKAEGRHPIFVYLPYLAGTADERQYRVMSDREQWFRIVMGQDEVARLITPEATCTVRLPEAISEGLSFKLSLSGPKGSGLDVKR
jgi:superfamily II DNA or RNA helicase